MYILYSQNWFLLCQSKLHIFFLIINLISHIQRSKIILWDVKKEDEKYIHEYIAS